MIDLEDAQRTLVRFLEDNVLGIGIKHTDSSVSDEGRKILSKGYVPTYGSGETVGRVMPAPVDAKWIVAHVPSLAFWTIGWGTKSEYPIKKKYISKDYAKSEVTTREEFSVAKMLLQAESYWRTNFEREMMAAQLSSLINTLSRGTGRLRTTKGDVIYLKMIESRSPQEPENATQGVYRLIQTWEMRVRELVPITEPMVSSVRTNVSYKGQPVK